MDFLPEESAIQVDTIEVDRDTMDMLKAISMASLPGLTVSATGGAGGGRGDFKPRVFADRK